MQFTGVADGAAVGDHQGGAAARVPRRLAVRPYGQLRPGSARGHPSGLDRVRPGGRATSAPPPGRFPVAAEHGRDMPWLGRQRRVKIRQFPVGGPPPHADQRRRPQLRPGQVDQPGLEERDIPVAPADVAPQGAEQARQQ